MSGTYVNRYSVTIMLVIVGALAGRKSPTVVGWRGARLANSATPAASPSPAVQLLPAGTDRLKVTPGEKGATYYWLESQVQRVTTQFPDAVTIAERGDDGGVRSRVTDLAGNELGRLHVTRVDDTRNLIHFISANGDVVQAVGHASIKPTLDWTNQQVYTLWRDRVKGGMPLEWQGALMRPHGAAARRVDDDIRSLEVEWRNGVRARAERRIADTSQVIPGRMLRGDVIVSRLTLNGTNIGVSNWFPAEHVLLWKLPGITEGYIDADTLKPIGGWSFEPDVFWVNLQTIAFHHFKTLINQQGVVAEQRPGLLQRISNGIAPTVHADEPGCDDLHWLDGSIFRYCCDTHDYCYAKSGCTSYSWWMWWSSWSCDLCNMTVVYCFMSAAHHVFYPIGA